VKTFGGKTARLLSQLVKMPRPVVKILKISQHTFNFLTGGPGPCRQAQNKQALPKSHFISSPLHGEGSW